MQVTRGSLAANCAAIGAGIALDPVRDVGVSWLPLHHDMGLVGFGCAALTAGVPVVFVPTATFLRDPGVWMRTVSAHAGTVTFGPSFAYSLAARRVRPEEVAHLDLSCVRVLGCGAEPINAVALSRFLAAYAPAGLDRAALTPAYGLAEATLAVSFATGLRTDAAADSSASSWPRSVITSAIWCLLRLWSYIVEITVPLAELDPYGSTNNAVERFKGSRARPGA